jgi:hypothetical protein
VTIGHDIWIGHGVTVMAGVTIGTVALIGTGAVVTHDVEPYRVVGGVHALFIKRRFTEAQAEAFMEIALWDWPRETYKAALPDILGDLSPRQSLAWLPIRAAEDLRIERYQPIGVPRDDFDMLQP